MVYFANIRWTIDLSKTLNETLQEGPTDLQILPKIKTLPASYIIKTSDDEGKNLISHLADLNLDEIKFLTAPIFRYGADMTNDVIAWKLLKVQDVSKTSKIAINPAGGTDIYQVRCSYDDLDKDSKIKKSTTNVYLKATSVIDAINYMSHVFPLNSYEVESVHKTSYQEIITLE